MFVSSTIWKPTPQTTSSDPFFHGKIHGEKSPISGCFDSPLIRRPFFFLTFFGCSAKAFAWISFAFETLMLTGDR